MNTSPTCETAQCHADTIGTDRVPGEATNVEFAVPIREITAEAGQGTRPQAGLKRSLRILCIDDDPQVRDFMSACLRYYDHRVIVAADGKQGVDLFRSATTHNQSYDVVITDLGMPDVNGYQVARIIKAESPTTPIIMMTGWGATMKDDGDTAPGVDVVVGKPPRMEELNDLLHQIAPPTNLAGK